MARIMGEPGDAHEGDISIYVCMYDVGDIDSIYKKYLWSEYQTFTSTAEMTGASKGPATLSRSARKFLLRAYWNGIYSQAVVHKKKRLYCEPVLS